MTKAKGLCLIATLGEQEPGPEGKARMLTNRLAGEQVKRSPLLSFDLDLLFLKTGSSLGPSDGRAERSWEDD